MAPRHIEILIVGGGIIGCSAAAFAAERGASVLLLEAATVGAGASGRNSGAVQHPFDALLAELHTATLAIYRELADANRAFVLAAEPAGLILLTPRLADAQARAAELAETHPELRPAVMAADELRRMEPLLAPDLAGVRLETGYPVPPDAATASMAARAVAAGAEIREGTPVAALLSDGERINGVRLADGNPIAADAVLVAAGPWSPPLVAPDGDWRPLRPTHGVTVQVALASPTGSVLEEGMVHTVNRTVEDAGDGDLHSTFSMVSVNGTSTVGSTFAPTALDPAATAARLLERGARFVPRLAGVEIIRSRVCARPQSVDGRPFVGPVPGRAGLHVCVGHGPWGISTGPASAELAVRAILDGSEVAIPLPFRADRALAAS